MITREILLRCSRRLPKELDEDVVVSAALANLIDRKFSPTFSKMSRKGASVYRVVRPEDEVVVRAAEDVLKRALGVKPSDRAKIVGGLLSHLREPVHHRLYRFDIKSFFESVDRKSLLERLGQVKGIDARSLLVVQRCFLTCDKLAIAGLPRGIPISTTLAEWELAPFDAAVRREPTVCYYARFVDDIVIITTAEEDPHDFQRRAELALLSGRRFATGSDKFAVVELEKTASFSFLGYQFAREPGSKRGSAPKISVDLSQHKLKKLKTRLVLSLRDYLRMRDTELLHSRLRCLTSNFYLRRRSGALIRTGLYYSYPEITDMRSLRSLDAFLVKQIMGRTGATPKRLKAVLSKAERRTLLRYSFVSGFRNRRLLSFANLERISRCWSHV